MRVKNIPGSYRFPVPTGYSSWLDYRDKKTDSKAFFVQPLIVVMEQTCLEPMYKKWIAQMMIGILSLYVVVAVREPTLLRFQIH